MQGLTFQESLTLSGTLYSLRHPYKIIGHFLAKVNIASISGRFHSYEDIAKSALENSIQNTYEKFVDEIEEDFLTGGQISFGTIFSKCGKWATVLENCVQIISELENKRKTGTAIIDIFESWFVLKASGTVIKV